MNAEKTHNEVASRAFQLWEKAGRPPSRDLEFWLEAEKQLGTSASVPVNAASTSPAPSARSRVAAGARAAHSERKRPSPQAA